MNDEAFCPATAAIDLLQEKWVLLILRELLTEPRGFNELSRGVGGCNPSTLSQRLDRLVDMGIVSKTVQSVMPPRTLYALTSAGEGLRGVVDAIDAWAARYLVERPGRSACCRGAHGGSDEALPRLG